MPQFDVRTITCPNCSSVNPYGVTICLHCGSPLVPALPAPEVPIASAALDLVPDPMATVAEPIMNSPLLPISLPTPIPAAAGTATNAASRYVYPNPAPQPLYAYPVKSRSTALLLEFLAWLLTVSWISGIGWFYAGNTTAGILWLVGYLMWNMFATVLDMVTIGFFACIHVPANIALIVVSAVALNKYTRQHPELFGA